MIISKYGFRFMVFTGRCYMGVLIQIGYDCWSHVIGVKIDLPLVLISIGYECKGDDAITAEEVPS